MLLPTRWAFRPIFLLFILGVHEVVNKENENDNSSTYYSSCEETNDHCPKLAENERISLVLLGEEEHCRGVFKLTPKDVAESSMHRLEWKKDMLFDMTRNQLLKWDELSEEMNYYLKSNVLYLTTGLPGDFPITRWPHHNENWNTTCSIPPSNKEITVRFNENFEAIAINWPDGNIYGCNGKKIFTYRYMNIQTETFFPTTLIDDVNISPRSLSIDPSEGWIFWINNNNWTSKTIEKARLDGLNRTSIVPVQISSKGTTQLCVDLIKTRLYWLQGNNEIWTCDYYGEKRKLLTSLISGSSYKSTVKAMSYFNDWIYWINGTENGKDTIHATNIQLFKHHEIKSTRNEPSSFVDIKVYELSTQPIMNNYCENEFFNCSYVCLRSPADNSGTIRLSCFCPDGFALGDDNLTCQNYSTWPENRPKNRVRTMDLEGQKQAPEEKKGLPFDVILTIAIVLVVLVLIIIALFIRYY